MTVVRRIRPDEGAALRDVRLAALADSAERLCLHLRSRNITDCRGLGGPGSGGLGRLGTSHVLRRGRRGHRGARGGVQTTSHRISNRARVHVDAPGRRRNGVGRLLVGAVLNWARTCGAQAVDLWVTRGNMGAENLYRAMGFVDAGDRQPLPSDPCKDEVRMRVDL